MIDYEFCNHCLSTVPLTEDILIFDNSDNSELVMLGYCNLCKNRVEKHYPLTKDSLQI